MTGMRIQGTRPFETSVINCAGSFRENRLRNACTLFRA